VVQHLDAVRHDRHLVERRLAVEHDEVVVAQMPFDDEPRV
jgi:hypothetical protein